MVVEDAVEAVVRLLLGRGLSGDDLLENLVELYRSPLHLREIVQEVTSALNAVHQLGVTVSSLLLLLGLLVDGGLELEWTVSLWLNWYST